jgi:hypothetical protein
MSRTFIDGAVVLACVTVRSSLIRSADRTGSMASAVVIGPTSSSANPAAVGRWRSTPSNSERGSRPSDRSVISSTTLKISNARSMSGQRSGGQSVPRARGSMLRKSSRSGPS